MISRYPNRFANGNKKFFSRHTDLPDDIERQLVSYILKMDARCFGVTRNNVRELAYEIATINGIKHRFNTEKRMTGKEWEQGFRKRHPEISLRVPEATSLNRIKGFNKSAVDRFYDLLKEIDDANQRTPDRIFNMDETGFSIVHTPSKVFAKKGRHQVRAATSAERGRNTTWVSCANASGVYVRSSSGHLPATTDPWCTEERCSSRNCILLPEQGLDQHGAVHSLAGLFHRHSA